MGDLGALALFYDLVSRAILCHLAHQEARDAARQLVCSAKHGRVFILMKQGHTAEAALLWWVQVVSGAPLLRNWERCRCQSRWTACECWDPTLSTTWWPLGSWRACWQGPRSTSSALSLVSTRPHRTTCGSMRLIQLHQQPKM